MTLVEALGDPIAEIYDGEATNICLYCDTFNKSLVFVKQARSAESIQQLRNECAMLRRLKNDGIIKLVYENVDGEHALGLQYAPGGDLFSHIQRGGLSECLVKKTARKILEILVYLHKEKIVHRDIKPENILVTSPEYRGDNVILADFGIAVELKTSHFQSTEASLEYAAPEVVLQQPVNEKVDIWALGVALFVCLTGRMPFSNRNMIGQIRRGLPVVKAARKHAKHPVAFDLILKMLAVDPKERLSASEALEHPWFQEEFISDMTL